MVLRTPAGQLASAFGNPEKMVSLLAPGVRWTLPFSTPFPRPISGRDAVLETMTKIWTEIYRPDVEVEFLDEVGDDTASAVRFTYKAFALWLGRIYENEYTLFARSGPDGIVEVNEAFDTKRTLDFFRQEEKTEFKGFEQAGENYDT
jgi:SnoaL-like domain